MTSSPIVPRHAERAIREALEDTRVVLVNGARQSGKSTLLRQFAPVTQQNGVIWTRRWSGRRQSPTLRTA
jgi:ABC-type transport system involved in cytochrome c biogenesis ATPase subunit